MLEIQGINKFFGEHKVLKNVNTVFDDGGIYCLMGASGMGKTTLLRIILGLEIKDSGEIIGVNIRYVSGKPPLRNSYTD